jgi:hypothetical protein
VQREGQADQLFSTAQLQAARGHRA